VEGVKKIEQLTLEKPFTDQKLKYTVLNSIEENCFEVHNLVNGKTYIVNPFEKICDCPDFTFRTRNGMCKHIKFLRSHDRIKPLIEKYEAQKNQTVTQENISISHLSNVGEGQGLPTEAQIPYVIMDRRDEDQILEELQGNVIKEYVYDFVQNGRQITGLSYAGVMHIAQRMGHIHTSEPIIQEMNGGYLAKVQATDVKKNLSIWGVAFQPKNIKLKDGREITDNFAVTKAVAKSTRNAVRKLFPEKYVIEMLKEYRKQKQGEDK